MIKEKLDYFEKRKTPPVYREVKTERGITKTEYKYLLCDCCKERIKLTGSENERTGGITELSYILTKSSNVKIALCNKCVNQVVKEFEE